MQTSFLATPQQWHEAWQRNWADANLLRVKVAVAYCSRHGAREIERAQRMRNAPLQLLVGLNDGVTDVFAREALFDWAQKKSEVEVRGEFQARGRFHPKVTIFELEHEVRVLVGSVNLTKSAFDDNTEAALEWVFPVASENHVLTTFQSWWQSAPILPRPGQLESEVAHGSIEERLVAMMKEGVLVNIEAILSPARGFFEKDVFQLGQVMHIQEGTLLVERQRQAQVFLIGQKTYKKLITCRDDAHKTCRALSFSCVAGHFVPVTALSQWKKEHHHIECRFHKSLQPFTSSTGRLGEQAQLSRELPSLIAKVWKLVHGTPEVPQENQRAIIKSALQQFEQRAPDFPFSVHLNVSLAPHPFPAMQNYAQTSSLVEVELHEFASQHREEILRDWMTTLLSTTRQLIVLTLDQLLDNRRKSDTHGKLRENLCHQLRWLNFYEDEFCQQTVLALGSHERTRHTLKEVRSSANADLLKVQEWPSLPLSEVLHDFASRVGWI